jgi:hypothetical protein
MQPAPSYIDGDWCDQDLEFDWVSTVQTDEVPHDDAWPSWSTQQKHQLRELHYRLGYTDIVTQHWMAFDPPLKSGLADILSAFPHQVRSHTALKLTPGHMLAWHYDTYAYFLHHHQLQESDMQQVWRSAVMLRDWHSGQVIQIGDRVISHWRRGDVFTWQGYTWHGTANFGSADMVVLQVSYLVQSP